MNRLAAEETVIMHGGNAVRLRPSLRAAYRLESRFRLLNVLNGIAACNVEIIEAILAETAVDPIAARRLLIASVDADGVRQLQRLADPLTTIVAHSYGVADYADEEHPVEHRERAGKPFSILQSLASLFEIATGWLEWSADDALAATPAQILAAQKGYVAKQLWLNGQTDNTMGAGGNDPRDLPSDAQVKEGIARLKALA